jgi:thiamine pyrophosphokinase
MTAFAILLGGEVRVTDRLRRQVAGARAIAADSGIRHAAALGLEPELWVGDFDSVEGPHRERYGDVPRRAFPAAKDRTDGEIAVEEALRLGAESLLLIGAFGGRTDHAVAHLAMAVRLRERGLDVRLSSGLEEAVPLGPVPVRIDLPAGATFSVLTFGDLVGLTLEGVQWPLDAADIPFGSSLTLSNVAAGPVLASVAAGRAVLVAQLGPT